MVVFVAPVAIGAAKMAAAKLAAGGAAKLAAGSAAKVAAGSAAKMAARQAVMSNMLKTPTADGSTIGQKGFNYIGIGIGVFLFILALGGVYWLMFKKNSKYSSRKLAPEKVMNISRREHGAAEHREYMFKKSHRNSYMKERSTAMGPGGQSATELGGFFGMKAPGAVLGQAPMGAPIKPPVIGNTISTEPRMSAGGVLIDTAAEEELEHEMQTELENKTAQRISKRARSNKVLGENNTGHSEQISELIASTTLASGNDFLRPFGQNSARYSGRNVQSRYIEPLFKDDVPNMN